MAPRALSLRVRRSTCLEASGREARRSSQRPAFGENVTQKEAHHPAKSWSGERLPAAGQRAGAQDTWGREHATGSALPGGADVGTCIPGFSTRCYFITRLTFIYFLVFTKHNTLGPEQLAFSSPEGTQQLQRGRSPRSDMQIAAFVLTLRVLRTTARRG